MTYKTFCFLLASSMNMFLLYFESKKRIYLCAAITVFYLKKSHIIQVQKNLSFSNYLICKIHISKNSLQANFQWLKECVCNGFQEAEISNKITQSSIK